MKNHSRNSLLLVVLLAVAVVLMAGLGTRTVKSANSVAAESGDTTITWTHLSTANGDLEPPSNSVEQTASLILDIDKDGLNDFVVAIRKDPGPSMIWYKRHANGWTRNIIDSESLEMTAGGAYYDIDGDDDLDIVMGGGHASSQVWWWENPYPDYDTDWTRRTIKDDRPNKHHDQMFGDFDDDGKTELVFWNQKDEKLILAEIPEDDPDNPNDGPRNAETWPMRAIYAYPGDTLHEGLVQADIDLDGLVDIVGGGRWFKYDESDGTFEANIIDDSQSYGRAAVGQLKKGGRPEAVFVRGDGVGRLKWYEWKDGTWIGTDLLGFDVDHGHSLQIEDVNMDGNLDIFVAEMRLDDGNPDAKIWIFFGDGNGNFTKTEVAEGYGNHESRMGDLDGDGDLDILGKPFEWGSPRLDIWLNESACETALDDWERHVIDSSKPARSIFIFPADVNYDGLQDVVSGGWWYRNPGSPAGTWTRFEIGSPLNNITAVYDFDGDGYLDLLGTEGIGSASNDDFVWARNDGSGNFTIRNNIDQASGDFLQGAAVDEFVIGNAEVALSWHRADNGIQMLDVPSDPINENWSWSRISPTSQNEALSSGDIDRDGDRDLLQGTKWLRNDTESSSISGPWSEHTLFRTTDEPDRNRLADIDKDGMLDAVVGYEAANEEGKLAWYEQPETATDLWTEHIIASDVIGPMSLDVADIDGDSDLDVVVGEHNMSNESAARVLIYENPGTTNGDWIPHLVSTGDEHHDGTQLVDIDSDGDLDVISIGWSHDRVLLYENKGCINPSPQPTATSTPNPAATVTNTPVPGATATNTPTTEPAATATSTAVPGSCTVDPTNLLVNPSFEDDTKAWRLYDEGSFTTSSPAFDCDWAARLSFNKISSSMQFYQHGFSLQPYSDYVLTFAAYSNSGNDFSVYLHKHSSPYTRYGIDDVHIDLSSSWETFIIPFTTGSEPVDPRLRFRLNGFASKGDIYWLDDVRIVPAGANPTQTPEATNTPTDTPAPGPSATPTDTAQPPTATYTPVPDATAANTPTTEPTATATSTAVPGNCTADSSNPLVNPDFEDGTEAWRLYDEGSFTTSSPAFECEWAARLSFNKISSSMQFYQHGFSLQPYSDYVLTIAAYSNSGNDFSVYLHKHSSPYTRYGIDDVHIDLSSSWETFSIPFTTGSEPVDPRLRFRLNGFASKGDIYWLDDVRIAPAGANPTQTPEATNTPTAVPSSTLTNTPAPGPSATPTDTPTPTSPDQYSLTIDTSGQGSVALDPPGGTYAGGTVVRLSAVPDPGWKFENWSDGLSGETNPQAIIMNDDKTISANFVQSAALFSEDFESMAVGEDPADWLDTEANNSMSEDESLFSVYAVGSTKAFGTTSELRNIHSHYMNSDNWSNYRFSGRMRITDAAGGVGVTFYSDYDNNDSYYRLRRYADKAFYLSPHGTSLTGDLDSGVSPQTNTWYHFVVEVENDVGRSDIRAKVWKDGTSEPAAWQINASDSSSSRFSAGRIGLWAYKSGSKYWDDLMVEPLTP